ncbi:MAG: AraC family transcriptional regulator [Campylobacteraceae bacterium]|jgi:AraC-like DNA-binding protein|nr:AraC family transcriptional regulator [Campylobacteraceae bacterium]
MKNIMLKENQNHIENGADISVIYLRAKEKLHFTPVHWHNELEIVKLFSDGVLTLGGNQYEYENGDIAVIPCGALHGYRENSIGNYTVFFINAHNLLFQNDNTCRQILKDFCSGNIKLDNVIKSSMKNYQIINSLLTELEKKHINYKPLFVRSKLLELVSFLITDNTCANKTDVRVNAVIREAFDYMEKNYAEQIKVDDICKKICISKFYFIRLFAKYCGQPPIDYLINLRLSKAIQMLHSGKSVTESALDCGFKSLNFFSKKFKEKYGKSPRECLPLE